MSYVLILIVFLEIEIVFMIIFKMIVDLVTIFIMVLIRTSFYKLLNRSYECCWSIRPSWLRGNNHGSVGVMSPRSLVRLSVSTCCSAISLCLAVVLLVALPVTATRLSWHLTRPLLLLLLLLLWSSLLWIRVTSTATTSTSTSLASAMASSSGDPPTTTSGGSLPLSRC